MRFSQATLGTRAERPVEITIRGVPVKLAVRPLSGDEEGLALSRATEYAKAKGAAKVEPNNPIFDLGLMVHQLALACVDVDSPANARAAFFDGGADQIFGSLDTEEIAFLHARYELWQSECSPSQRARTPAELVELLVKIVEAEDDLPFALARPGTLLSLLRITGRLCLSSPELRSQLISLSVGSTTA